ncbi:20S-pre-rRNA D-site endonuclease NOB1 [Ceratobasidium sp. AG-Ba]|nr:20S-pre-rRNA D-site endonuclease NOB1 [Ceratobasidium sp. AG-Ba]
MASPYVRTLVLDAGPLLSLQPLRGLAERYVTVPQVMAELKDARVREHLERLELSSGVKLEVIEPDITSLAKVNAFSKKTGDYSVLSVADLRILALTAYLHEKAQSEPANQVTRLNSSEDDAIPSRPDLAGFTETTAKSTPVATQTDDQPIHPAASAPDMSELQKPVEDDDAEAPNFEREPLDAHATIPPSQTQTQTSSPAPLYDDPSSEDDSDGEWITPDNVAKHKSRALQMTSDDSRRNAKTNSTPSTRLDVACMTVDYAMQNVLIQMGLNLVGTEGRRISTVKSWVLRCHACFKLCKDNTKKFCPSCGNATLLRTSVTTSAPGADGSDPVIQVHLKKNFQYKNRGTRYSIPLPKPGAARGGAGSTNIILREDQVEFQKGLHQEAVRQRKEDKRVERALAMGKSSGMSWDDPDWVPEILTGTRRSTGGLPAIGHGRKNPNEARRKKR